MYPNTKSPRKTNKSRKLKCREFINESSIVKEKGVRLQKICVQEVKVSFLNSYIFRTFSSG